jgi:hypothetical protein
VHVLVEACAAAGDARAGLAAADIPVSSPLWRGRTRTLRAEFAATLAEERSRNAAPAIVPSHDR